MEGNHHALVQEFPELKQKIHDLKMSDNHFKKLCEKYEEIDKAVARAEARTDLLSQEDENELRMQRTKLKDEIYHSLTK
jgi:uncharacterized protein YdcH (DUF465 family)